MHLARVSDMDVVALEGSRGARPSFKFGTVERRGVRGECVRQPALCFWAHVSQRLSEYRLSIAKRSWSSYYSWKGTLAGLAPRAGELHIPGDVRTPDWWWAHFSSLPQGLD
eukprot:4711909-Pyramimonas_sp.AAC.1